jgi:N-terminal domain of galactosyltransferase
MNSIPLLMPWHDIGDRSRTVAHDWCRLWWRSAGFDVIEGSGTSRAAMCNDAARKAIASSADVLVFVDADTWTPVEQIHSAIERARSTNRLVHAFTDYARISQINTQHTLGRPIDRINIPNLLKGARVTQRHVSGASAISVALWKEIGGFDERFTVWGLEDRAWDMAAGVFGGPVERIEGSAFHWWHKTDPKKALALRPSKDDPRVQLIARYCAAAGCIPDYGQLGRLGASGMIKLPSGATADPEAMRALLAEDGAPGSSRIARCEVV